MIPPRWPRVEGDFHARFPPPKDGELDSYKYRRLIERLAEHGR